MRAASPPASAADILEATNNRRNNRPGIKRYMMTKQSSLDGDDVLDLEADDEDFEDATAANTDSSTLDSGFGRDSPRPGTPITEKSGCSGFNLQLLAVEIGRLFVMLPFPVKEMGKNSRTLIPAHELA